MQNMLFIIVALWHSLIYQPFRLLGNREDIDKYVISL